MTELSLREPAKNNNFLERRGHERTNRTSERVEVELASIDCSHAGVLFDIVFYWQEIFVAQRIRLGKNDCVSPKKVRALIICRST